ncbi:ribosomal subunit interface protein [Candidatus Uhrbacteria bacterium RIFOXYB2_FULL_45_11]|uniref:Ribosomal subunit interface protein n=1 Tax=Candidatus Uhrbacteria bacterium RIFOXYB2_FULL_45_11 TaxID=1802421 RepID=A0A1F7W7D0_9BACT|nr:MAG: ribosomal subunit interface protein [Candidatus Uhrbacteria bacterium RIFOXYB2_FULL_45_11]
MKITSILGTNMELTEAIKMYVEERALVLEKLTSSFEESADLRVELGKTSQHHTSGPFFFAELHLTAPGTILTAKAEGEDLYAVIDEVRDDLKRQLVDMKEKNVDQNRGPRPGKE